MKKAKLLPILSLLLSITLIGCNKPGPSSSGTSAKESSSKHVHTYDETKWESDENQHWHPATCEHNVKGSTAPHDFKVIEAESTKADCKNPGKTVKQCSVCGYKTTVDEPKTDHNFEGEGVANNLEGCADSIIKTCKTCNAQMIEWKANAIDQELSQDFGDVSGERIRFVSPQFAGQDDSKPGTHFVWKINVPKAATGAGLAFDIQTNTNTASIFDAKSSDSTPGYIKNGDGQLVEANRRYGLKVNGAEITLGDNSYGDVEGNTRDWFDWPVSFDLVAGVNTIEVYSLGGYRAYQYNYRLILG